MSEDASRGDPGRWRRAKELFAEAVARPARERAAFLEDVCADDPDLREEVMSLIQHHSEDPGFLESVGGPETADLVGTTVSHYRIVEQLGEGAVGVVYRAHDTRLDRPVALKFLWPRTGRAAAAEDSLEARFLSEARAVSALDHPNVGSVHGIDRADDGRLFIAMAYYEGETLKARMARGPLPVEEAVEIGYQLAAGLSAAHEHGVVHRDVKPANVIITSNGVAKLIDFGIAKTPTPEALTRTGQTLGTVAYMSPEQAAGEAVDRRTDLWSLGVILYEMVTGRLPFEGVHELAVLRSILTDEPESPARARSDLPAPLVEIIERCLTKDRDARIPSAAGVADVLSSLRTSPAPRAAPARSGHRTVLQVAAAGLALLAIGVLAVLFGRGGQTPPGDPIDSIAVLPFDNLSGDPERDYFVGGMQEALLNSLAQIEALRVTSRTSTLRYAGTDLTAPEIAAELGVDAIVEGSVYPVGDTVRITVQLIDGRTDGHVWTAEYDRDVRDVLVLFSEVAETVADEVQIAIAPDEAELFAAAGPVDPRLFDLYMRGRAAYITLSAEGFERAIRIFEEAIRIDSTYARAWAGLAGTYLLQAYRGFVPPAVSAEESRRAAVRAVALDPGLALAHTALGWVQLADLEVAAASASFQRALDLNPNDVDALHGFGDVLTVSGRAQEGLAYVERARDLDPYSPLWGHTVVGHLHMMRRYEDALAEAERVQTRWPEAPVDGLRASALWQLGRYAEALERFELAVGDRPDLAASVDAAYRTNGPEAAARVFGDDGAARAEATGMGAFATALWYARARDAERTLDWVERARDSKAADLYQVGVRPEFQLLHEDPRFRAFVASLGLSTVDEF